MDEFEERLVRTVEGCKESYSAWRANPADVPLREKLMEHMHDLRRVAARLEIELAVADRNAARAKPIPIPAHRASGHKVASQSASGQSASASAVRKVRINKPSQVEEAPALEGEAEKAE